MTTIYTETDRVQDFSRYKDQWETGVLAATLESLADLTDQDRRDLVRTWLIGAFNGSSSGIYASPDDHSGSLDWIQAGPTQFDCIYTGPMGVKCSLARIYEQPNGSWAALVIAGVKEDQYAAIGAAEWALARLSAFG